MTNLLADRHQGGLFRSLQYLADRMGWTLYTPTGLGWWEENVWNFGRDTYPDDRLARQFLTLSGPDTEFPDVPINYVTLEQAKEMPWAFVMATVQDNQYGFWRFAKDHGATYLLQVGNTGQQIEWTFDPLVLSSSEMPIEGKGIVYHQEIDPVFAYHEPFKRTPIVRSFVHNLNRTPCFPLWQEFAGLVPFSFRFGHAPEDPDPTYVENAKPIGKIADYMAASTWGWHDKIHGDGFGHVIHGWAAVGRPLIGHASHYAGKMAEPFWRDMETCIDLDRHSVAEAAEIVNGIGWDEYVGMCRAIRATFDELVDYDKEAEQIRAFIDANVAVPA